MGSGQAPAPAMTATAPTTSLFPGSAGFYVPGKLPQPLPEGVAFSIPSNLVKRVMHQMLSQGAIQRGYLGMQLSPGFEANDAVKLGLERVQGALVEKIYPDTPAAVAGLQTNDVILSVESVTIRNENHLINLISGLPAGQRVRMQVWRDRTTISLDATVGDWSKAQNRFKADQ